jgi:hypothetical protein
MQAMLDRSFALDHGATAYLVLAPELALEQAADWHMQRPRLGAFQAETIAPGTHKTEPKMEETLMRLLTRSMPMLATLTLLYLLFPFEAHAYLDPGTGSYILQIALATIVGIGFAIKLFWGRIKSFFQDLRSKGEGSEQDED